MIQVDTRLYNRSNIPIQPREISVTEFNDDRMINFSWFRFEDASVVLSTLRTKGKIAESSSAQCIRKNKRKEKGNEEI